MNIRTACSSIIISLLLAGSLNAQNYVLEWQSPEGFELAEREISRQVLDNSRFDMDGDGLLEIFIEPQYPSPPGVIVYDGVSRNLEWSYTFPTGNPGGCSGFTFFGFYDIDADGVKEALIGMRDECLGNGLLWFVNWQTSEIEFTLGDSTQGIGYYHERLNVADIDNDGKEELVLERDDASGDYVEIWGDGTSVGISGGSPSYSPQTYTLSQNYPNPFNPATKIEYAVQQAGHVTIKVYNLRGEVVKTLVDQNRPMGEYAAVWDGKNDMGSSVASGQYFYQLSIGDFVTSKKLLLLK